METLSDYRKYKWFYTSSGKLVVGGKNADQNDELLHLMKKQGKDFFVMHTSSPGSPFSVILSEVKKVKKSDLKECATFTGCFSKAWKSGNKSSKIDIFKLSQLHKNKIMKSGTWSVVGKVDHQEIEFKLALTTQEKLLRAVPESTVKDKSQILLKICPGSIDKKDIIPKLQIELHEAFSENEILSALPAGGISICR